MAASMAAPLRASRRLGTICMMRPPLLYSLRFPGTSRRLRQPGAAGKTSIIRTLQPMLQQPQSRLQQSQPDKPSLSCRASDGRDSASRRPDSSGVNRTADLVDYPDGATNASVSNVCSFIAGSNGWVRALHRSSEGARWLLGSGVMSAFSTAQSFDPGVERLAFGRLNGA
jgi:hypothetical protein